MTRNLPKVAAIGAALMALASLACAAGADLGQAEKQATNWTAIGMFAAFVMNSVPTTKAANMPIAVQLVACFSA